MASRKVYPVKFILRNFETREDGKVYWREDNQLRDYNANLSKAPAGCLTKQGHLIIKIDGTTYQAHHIAWILAHGTQLDTSLSLQHKDRDKTNNRIENLIPISRKEIARNITKLHPRNKSGYTGVYWQKSSKLWHAFIMVDGKAQSIGYYRDKSDAIAARRRAETKYGFAHQE